MNDFKLIVFDWDGTLIDSAATIVACMQGAMEDLGLTPLPDPQIRNIIGLGMTEAIRALYPDADEAFTERFRDRYGRRFMGVGVQASRPFEGVRHCLENLNEAGYLLAVATGKSRRGLDRALRETGLREQFIATRCADETRSKPHPQMLHELIDYAGVAPAETLMVGDTEYDLQMARAAGAGAIAVSCGVHERDRLLNHAPLACLAQAAELAVWLQEGAAAGTFRARAGG